jgi:hypothetical protein
LTPAVPNRLPRIIEGMWVAPGRPYATTNDEKELLNAYALGSCEALRSPGAS